MLMRTMRRKGIVLIVAFAVLPLLLYVLLSPMVAWPLYSALLFHPDRRTHDISVAMKLLKDFYKAEREDVSFRSANGRTIRGWYFEKPDAKRVFLVSYGRGGNMHRRLNLARVLLQAGGSVLLYDYEGYGLSEGTPSLDSVCDAALAAYDYLVEQKHVKGKNIIGFGESFGTGVTGQLVRNRELGGAILLSGYSSLLRAGRDALPWLHLYPDALFPEQMLDNVAVFSQPHPPLLIVHGKCDNLLSFHNAEDLFAKATPPKMLLAVPDGKHCSFGAEKEFFRTLNDFLTQNNL